MITPKIEKVLADPAVHGFTKEILRKALTLDALDAVYDVELAYECLRERFDLLAGRCFVCHKQISLSEPFITTDEGRMHSDHAPLI